MASSAREDTLSPDELRKRLYQTFRNKGVLDTLKTQLRNQLIQELKQPSLTGGQPVPRPVPVKSEPVLVSACNSIVADHLCTSGYEYTLSVFYPESGLRKEKVSTKDLLQLLRISPESVLYRSLALNKDDKGFLISLLTQLTHHYAPSLCHDANTQTTSVASYGDSLVEKMKTIDEEYEKTTYRGGQWYSFESKLSAYRKDIEAKVQAEMTTEMQHFKNVEIAKVRLEEKQKFNKEFDKLKQELGRTYEMKAKALTDREKNAIDRLQKQHEIEEKNLYAQRQSVLKEIETFRNRENELRIRMEAFEKTCQIHNDKVKTTEELLRRRELAVRTMEDTHDQRLKIELSRYQLELKEEYIKRTEKLTENENRNKVETSRIQKESAVIDGKMEESMRACSELKRLQVELDTAQQQISLLNQQKELLQERLESMSDYTNLKREKAEHQMQLLLLKKQLEEAQETNRLLHADLGKPSKDQLALQKELRRLQNARRMDEVEFHSQRQVLQAQFQSEVERCAQLNAQLIEYEERSQLMTNYMKDIKVQLRQTQQGGPTRESKFYWSDSQDANIGLGAEAKARMEDLQKEAETLEEAYRNYQQRAVYPTITHKLTSRPISPQHQARQAHPSHRPDPTQRKKMSLLPNSHSPLKSKMSHKPLSLETTRTLPLPPYDTRSTVPPTQVRVTFSEGLNPPQSTGLIDHTLHPFTKPIRDRVPQEGSNFPSTAHFSSRIPLHREISEESVESLSGSLEMLPDEKSASHSEVVSSGELFELSPPRNPQLMSTARDQPSPAKVQPELSTSESSPQPEKISLEDLTGISEFQEQPSSPSVVKPSHIPELLLDSAVPLSEEAPDDPTNPHPPDLTEEPVDLLGQTDDPHSGESPQGHYEDDEQRWERERKERQERRQKEQEEARKREEQELERMEKEMLLKDVEQAQEEEEEEALAKEGDEVLKQQAEEKESKSENPLEKYMKMVLEAREKPQTQSPGREEHLSPEARSSSEEKDNSIAAVSHKDEEDDFW